MDGNDTSGPSADNTDGPDERRKDLFVGSAALAIGIFVLAVLIPQTIGPFGSGATYLAMIGAGSMAVFGGLLLLATLRRDPPSGVSDVVSHTSKGRMQATGLVLIALAYAWGLEWIGFLPASYLSLAALLVLLGVRSVLMVLILPAVVVTAIYLGIDVALGASLPEGRIEWPFLSFQIVPSLGHSIAEHANV